jgi:hypothetical protein
MLLYDHEMKPLLLTVAAILSICVLIASPVLAHSGNTDASGGHTCMTNCESYGLSYGEYHYHNGGYYTDDYYDQGSEDGVAFVDQRLSYIVSSAENEGETDGSEDGRSGGYEDESPDSGSVCDDVNFQNDSSPQDYYDGFMDAYSDSCRDIYSEKYSSSYAVAYAAALESYEEKTLENDQTNNGTSDGSSSWLSAFWPYAIIGIVVLLIANWESIKSWWKG